MLLTIFINQSVYLFYSISQVYDKQRKTLLSGDLCVLYNVMFWNISFPWWWFPEFYGLQQKIFLLLTMVATFGKHYSLISQFWELTSSVFIFWLMPWLPKFIFLSYLIKFNQQSRNQNSIFELISVLHILICDDKINNFNYFLPTKWGKLDVLMKNTNCDRIMNNK